MTAYLLFESWHHLLDFMLDAPVYLALVSSSQKLQTLQYERFKKSGEFGVSPPKQQK
jgi:hypothetical protein